MSDLKTDTPLSHNNNNDNNISINQVPPSKNYEIDISKINDDSHIIQVYNFINNEYHLPVNNKYFNNYNPATNKIISIIPRSDDNDINLAIEACKKSMHQWSNFSNEERSIYLLKIANEIKKISNIFSKLETRDNGKPLLLSSMIDIPRAIKNFEFFSTQILHEFEHCHSMKDAINYSYREPLGIVGLITPWNLPLYLLTWKIAPAIAYGNCCICKPSELTPMTAYLLTYCIKKAGVPPGVINIIHGYGNEAGQPLCNHKAINGISFTGGTLTGSKISKIASPLFKKLSLELGGKNANIICDDCDINNTVINSVRAAFANQGQICLCGSRIFVQKKIYKEFIEQFKKKTIEMFSSKIGDPLTSGFGSLISQEHRKKIEYYVDLAKKEGGNIILGGERPKNLPEPFNSGAFYLPTIITDLHYAKSKVATEEIFGPVVTIHEWNNDNEMIEMINSSTDYGLAGSVFTKNINRGHKIAQKIKTGMIWVNCWLYRDLRVPFGGVKNSGIGRDGGFHSKEFFTEIKNICIKIDDE